MSSVYDARGRVTRQSDQHGYNTYYVYDGADRLIRVTNAQGISTSYTYDEVGNMTSVTDGTGNVTEYAYDDFGRVVKTTNALGNPAYTTYDKSGNVLTSTDYAGNITSYTYDSLDRVSSKTNNDGTVNYTYTADGKISSVTDSTGTTMFTYDLMDGLTKVDYPDGKALRKKLCKNNQLQKNDFVVRAAERSLSFLFQYKLNTAVCQAPDAKYPDATERSAVRSGYFAAALVQPVRIHYLKLISLLKFGIFSCHSVNSTYPAAEKAAYMDQAFRGKASYYQV